jgi:uncharacterized protein YcfJ
MPMNSTLKAILATTTAAFAITATAQITFFEKEDFQGRSFTTERAVGNFANMGFNDRASSVVVNSQRWEVCEDIRYGGRCAVLRPGRYAALADMALNNRVSSVQPVSRNRRVEDGHYAPDPQPLYDSRRRNDEPLFAANVTAAHAVMGPTTQRCWMEREAVVQEQDGINAGGAVVGALLGGILGHQVGGGVGKDIATAGGAVAGAVVGANVGRNKNPSQGTARDVQRCTEQPNEGPPAYWDVVYNFRGVDHRVQMTTAPGPTILVNALGEPRT